MQAVAAEMNLAETAFVARRGDGDHDLRWFTPSVEVDLCGHATLAAAHVLGGSARFHTRSGVLACTPGPDGRIEMDFPATPSTAADPPPDLTIDGVTLVRPWPVRRPHRAVRRRPGAQLRARPGRAGRARWPGRRHHRRRVTGDGIDCVSRVFGPNVGIPEDPVTGSAHCTLAVHWGERLGRTRLVGHQASPRGGTVHMRREGDRVILGGQAVTVSTVQMVV